MNIQGQEHLFWIPGAHEGKPDTPAAPLPLTLRPVPHCNHDQPSVMPTGLLPFQAGFLHPAQEPSLAPLLRCPPNPETMVSIQV